MGRRAGAWFGPGPRACCVGHVECSIHIQFNRAYRGNICTSQVPSIQRHIICVGGSRTDPSIQSSIKSSFVFAVNQINLVVKALILAVLPIEVSTPALTGIPPETDRIRL